MDLAYCTSGPEQCCSVLSRFARAARSTAPLHQRRCDDKTSPRESGEACRDEESTRVGVGIRLRHPVALGVLVDLRGWLRATTDDHDRRQGKQDRHEEQCVTDRLQAIMPNVRDDLLLLVFGTKACPAGDVPKVPFQAWRLGPSVCSHYDFSKSSPSTYW